MIGEQEEIESLRIPLSEVNVLEKDYVSSGGRDVPRIRSEFPIFTLIKLIDARAVSRS